MAAASRGLRTASFGTASTLLRCSTITFVSPFMPGFSRPSLLSSVTRTGNIVTFCWMTADGSIFSTVPMKRRSGYASTVTVAVWPGRTCPMSVSLNSARTRTRPRSAIFSSVVPPPNEPVADVMTVPMATVRSMIVPPTGAVTVASSRLCLRRSRLVRADTRADCAFAKSICAASCSVAVMIRLLNSSSARFFCAVETSSLDRAAASCAATWSYWFCTSRVSICTSRSPGFTMDPVSTGSLTICPPALDFTSTTKIGSTTPVACASMMMSRRVTATVETGMAFWSLDAQAAPRSSVATTMSLRTGSELE